MKLVDAYSVLEAPAILYRLLQERTPEQSISHKRMPSQEEHMAHFCSRPYRAWYLMQEEGWVGAIYLSQAREIGVFVFRAHQGKGYGSRAVKAIMKAYPGPFLANVAPANARSAAMFEGMGFRKVQETFAYDHDQA